MIDSTPSALSIARSFKELSGDVQMVDESLAASLLDRVAKLHIADPNARYWWEGLRDSQSFPYGSDAQAWSVKLAELLGDMEGDDVYLAIADDEDQPWPVIKTRKRELIELISELPFFEYFVFSDGCAKVVFDTHHNILIVTNDPYDRTK